MSVFAVFWALAEHRRNVVVLCCCTAITLDAKRQQSDVSFVRKWHAERMGIAILTGVFTLIAAIIGFVGSGFIQARAQRREERAQFERLITEALSAADDMWAALRDFRKYEGMTLIVDAAKNAENYGFGAPPWMTDGTIPLPKRLLRAALLAISQHYSEKPTDIHYLQLIFPAMQRLRTVLLPLRIGEDPAIAESANRLAEAAEARSISSARKNQEEWERAHAEFRIVAVERLRALSGTRGTKNHSKDGLDESIEPPVRRTRRSLLRADD